MYVNFRYNVDIYITNILKIVSHFSGISYYGTENAYIMALLVTVKHVNSCFIVHSAYPFH